MKNLCKDCKTSEYESYYNDEKGQWELYCPNCSSADWERQSGIYNYLIK